MEVGGISTFWSVFNKLDIVKDRNGEKVTVWGHLPLYLVL